MKKIDIPAEKVFFTADTHFGHEWIVGFNNRPYSSIKDMDQGLIDNWNEVVPRDGLTFVLGDIGFTSEERIVEIFNQLQGHKILIRGNHDKNYKEQTLQAIFSEIHELLYIRVTDERAEKFNYMVLCHYPMLDWVSSFRGAWQLFGHVHTREIEAFNTFKSNQFAHQYDVGVDNNNYHPVSFYQVKEIIEEQRKSKLFKHSNYY